MSPLQSKPIIHGRDHAPGGADPISGLGGEVTWEDVGSGVSPFAGIQFDTDNTGGWLGIIATGAGAPGYGIKIEGHADVLIRGYVGLTIENLADQVYNPGKHLWLNSGDNMEFNINLFGPNPQSYLFRFDFGVPIMEIRKTPAGVVSFHIKSGATWIADL